MAARNITASSLPRMTFTKDDEQRYRELSDACLSETLGLYEEFLYGNNRVVDKRRWKLVKERENVFVYRERARSNSASKAHGPAGYSSDDSAGSGHVQLPSQSNSHQHLNATQYLRDLEGSLSSVDTTGMGPGAALAAKSRLPVMITTAAIPGTLEDAMYGTFVDDTATYRRRSYYQKDLSEDSAILATVARPTREDPYQYLGIAWMLRNFPGLGAVVKRRDFLFLQRTGLATTSRGERIGFSIMQSVSHRDLPQLIDLDIIRAHMTVCALYRQMGDQVVDVFMQTVMHPGGNVAGFFAVQETATAMLSAGKSMACAHKKKLFWLMRKNAHKGLMDHSEAGSPTSSTSSGPASSMSMTRRLQRHETDHCASCKKSFGKLFSSGGSYCQICQQVRRVQFLFIVSSC